MQRTSRFYLEATHQLQLKDLSGLKIQPEEDEAMEDLLSQPQLYVKNQLVSTTVSKVFLDFSLHEMREPEPRRGKKNPALGPG